MSVPLRRITFTLEVLLVREQFGEGSYSLLDYILIDSHYVPAITVLVFAILFMSVLKTPVFVCLAVVIPQAPMKYLRGCIRAA